MTVYKCSECKREFEADTSFVMVICPCCQIEMDQYQASEDISDIFLYKPKAKKIAAEMSEFIGGFK